MKLKKITRKVIEKTPLISEFYHYYWLFPRCPNLFRGIYLSFHEAMNAIPYNFRSGYEGTQSDQHIDIKAEINRVETIDPDDYYLLPWLQTALTDSSRVFDLGGSTGKAFYSYRKHLTYPSSLQWIVCDLPGAVKIGNKILKEIDSPGLSFTTDFGKAEQAEIFLTSGTLQYLEPSLSQLLGNLKDKPCHVIVNRVPMYEGKQYITLQNLVNSYVPYKIQNRTQFINSMFELGYRLIDVWQKDRTVTVPFHPECFVNSYQGFYFKLK